ncbi:MAG: hypothetical protein E6543_18715 [Enterobacter hormaechei]|nr:hypothetical protein [Enterobacter hormaechei]
MEQNRHSANRSMVADGGQAYLSGSTRARHPAHHLV